MVLTISMRAPRVNATRASGAQLEKSLLARCSMELHLIYYHTCKHLLANHFIESALQFAGERSGESCHKLALAKPLSANELHPGNVSSAWGNRTPVILPQSLSDLWHGGWRVLREVGHAGQGHTQCWDVLPSHHLQPREATPASLYLILHF